MSYGLFEDLHAFDEGHRTAARKVVAVANKRVADQFSGFLAGATDETDRKARLSLIEDDVRQVIADVVEEYGSEATDIESLEETIMEHLGEGVTDIDAELADAPTAVGSKSAGGHASDCGCGFCANKGKGFGDKKDDDDDKSKSNADDDDDSSDGGDGGDGGTTSKTADADRDGGGAVKTVDLPSADESGLGGPSPEIDHSKWDPEADRDIDTEMDGSPHPTVEQDIFEPADHSNDFLDQTDAVTETQDVTQGSEDSGVGPDASKAADQWTGTEGLASPVSKADPDKNPLREILADQGYDEAIDQYEANNE